MILQVGKKGVFSKDVFLHFLPQKKGVRPFEKKTAFLKGFLGPENKAFWWETKIGMPSS